MRKFTCILAALLFFSSPYVTRSLTGKSAKEQSGLRSPIRLLPGYRAEIVTGWEGGAGGKFSKEGGLTIDFQMGIHAESAAGSMDRNEIVWREEQTVNGQRAVCVYTSSKELVITFPSFVANFRTKIRDEKDLTETLLMVLTFDPIHGYPTDPKDIKTIAPSSK